MEKMTLSSHGIERQSGRAPVVIDMGGLQHFIALR
jgi:hypothetical protein